MSDSTPPIHDAVATQLVDAPGSGFGPALCGNAMTAVGEELEGPA
ncbi:hypothetical protein [Halorientalis sp.]|nr:hypothetical protein [Halorientalis sp.]